MLARYRMVCTECEGVFGDIGTSCPVCGAMLRVEYSSELTIAERNDMWRYMSRLPISDEKPISLGEGWTPLIDAERLARRIGVRRILLKDETRNPTGSFVDRGVSVEITKIVGRNASIVCPTLGDTGASIAAYSARAGVKSIIYAPRDTNVGKLYQMLLCGAEVRIVSSYEVAVEEALRHRRESRIFSETSPYYLEGLKTIAFEIAEQMGWTIPDAVIVPMGTGALISMIYKGFRELFELGIIREIPRLVGVQASAADIIVRMFEGEKPRSLSGTLAVDLCVDRPSMGEIAVRSIRKSGGIAISVDDSDILEAIKLLASTEGIISSPSGAVAVAAIGRLLEEYLSSDETLVAIVTGSGMKTIDALSSLIPLGEISGRLVGTAHYRARKFGPTKLLILKILSRGPIHGYGIRKKLKELYGLSLSLPTVYQHLRELEESGAVSRIERRHGRRKSYYYVLTDEGRRLVEA